MRITSFLLFLLIFTSFSCSEKSDSPRSFYMGFTPWPYAATIEAVDNVYAFINTNGDLIAHHLQQGIPFTATDINDYSTYHSNIRAEIDGRINKTATGKIIYLAIDSLNGARDDLTDLWESSGNMPRQSPWDTLSFDDTEVQIAYVAFAKAVIERFRTEYGKVPEYFNYGTEISELMINSDLKYTGYIPFAHYVYDGLKASYPNMKLMVSIALKDPGSTGMDTVTNGFSLIKNYVDIVGISTYGYAFYSHAGKGDPDNLPAAWISQIKTIAPGKPYGVTETGWIAESLSIPAYSLNVTSNAEYQRRYLQKLFAECNNDLAAHMIIWFTAFDYDTLWNDILKDDLSKIWKDTGLIDESLNDRISLTEWKSWHKKNHK
jgi:hypothetical protein